MLKHSDMTLQVRPMIGIKHSKIWFRIFVRIQGVAIGAY